MGGHGWVCNEADFNLLLLVAFPPENLYPASELNVGGSVRVNNNTTLL
jgi:hypothetical protein